MHGKTISKIAHRKCALEFNKLSIDVLILSMSDIMNESQILRDDVTLERLNEEMTSAVMPVTVFIGMEAAFGFFGNVLILHIYSWRYPKSNFRCFVLFMAAIDLATTITGIPGEIFSQLHWYNFHQVWICKTKSFFNAFCILGSGQMLLLTAFDRYKKVCKPLSWQMHPSLAKKLSLGALAVSAVLACPVIELWGIQTQLADNNGHKVEVKICEKSEKYKNTHYPFAYLSAAYIAPTGLIMLVSVILNFRVAKKVFFSMSYSQGLQPDDRHFEKFPRDIIREEDNMIGSRRNAHSMVSTESTVWMKGVHITKTFFGHVSNEKDPTRIYGEEQIPESIALASLHEPMSKPSHTKKFKLNHTAWVRTSFDPDDSNFLRALDTEIVVNCDIANHVTEEATDVVSSEIHPLKPKEKKRKTPQPLSSKRKDVCKVRYRTTYVRVKRKTLIMLILTSVFVITNILYLTLVSFSSESATFLHELTNSEKVIFFFFWRLYFLNCIINPILYGWLDPRFRSSLKALFKCK